MTSPRRPSPLRRILHPAPWSCLIAAAVAGCASTEVPRTSVVTAEIPFDLGPEAPTGIELQFHDGLVVATRGDALRCNAKVDVSGDTDAVCQAIVEALSPAVRRRDTDGVLQIDLHRPESVPMDAIHVCYTLEIPDGVPLRVQTARGQVHIRGLGGDVTVITGEGAIRARMDGGEADLRSRSGLVSLSGNYAQAYVESGTGRIETVVPMCDPPARLEIRTVTGETDIEIPENVQVDLTYDGALADLRTELPIDWQAWDSARKGTLGRSPAAGKAVVVVMTAGAKVRFQLRPPSG